MSKKNNQDVKQEQKEATSSYIKLKVVCDGSNDINFRVKMDTQLGKLMESYSERQGISKGSVRFLFDGSRIGDNQTPKQFEMENDDVIEVQQGQDGG